MRKTALIGALLFALSGLAEEKTFRSEFQLATKAAEEKNATAYLSHMQEALNLEHDRPGRPFYQYHLARALAMNGRDEEALAMLEAMWNERIEGPMIVFADSDPAFDGVRQSPRYAQIRGLFDSLVIELLPAGGSVYEIAGAGCTLAASIGPDGVLLVDSGYPRTTPSLLAAVKKITGESPRIRYVVNTHGHYDHVASNHRVDREAVVIAHPAAVDEMKTGSDFVPGHRIPPVEPEALPDVMTGGELTIRFNGETVRVIALPAHTSGDLVVWFEGSKVLHMGDDYFGTDTKVIYPGPVPPAFFGAITELLKAVPDDAVVLSGHASRVQAKQLKAAVGASHAVFVVVRDALAAGKTGEEIVSAAEAQGHPRRWAEFYLRTLKK